MKGLRLNPFRLNRFYQYLFVVLIFGNLLWAGAWGQKRGGYYLKVSGNYLYTTKEFNHEGNKIDILKDFIVYENTAFRDFSLQLYGEYGVTDWFTFIGDLSFKNLTSKRTEVGVAYFESREISITTSGFSDIRLYGRFPLIQSPVVFSLQTGVKIPLGYDKVPSNDGPTLGTGETEGEGWLLFGKSLFPLPFYTTGGFGYRSRSGPVHDEFLYNFEIGYSRNNFLLKMTLDGVQNTSTPPDLYGRTVVTPIPGGGGVLPEVLYGDQDYLKLVPGLIYKFRKDWGIQLELINITSGKNIISGTTYAIGFIKTR